MRVLVVNPPNKPYSSSSLLIEPIDVLTVAREKVNAKFLCSSAESIDLPDESLDVVISTWVVGTIQGVDRKAQAINEATRVLRKGGSIYLVENDLNGEIKFEILKKAAQIKDNDVATTIKETGDYKIPGKNF